MTEKVEMIEDALGRVLALGDWVAHISRVGSATKIKQRKVTGIGWEDSPHLYDEEGRQPYLLLDGGHNHVMPYNCVKVAVDV